MIRFLVLTTDYKYSMHQVCSWVINPSINVTGADWWDAGTKALNISSTPFVAVGIATDSPAGCNNLISATESLSAPAGLGNGQTLEASLIDFLFNPSTFNVVTISIEEVPEPATASVLLLGLLGLGYASRRRINKA